MADIKQTIKDFYKVAQTRDFARDFQFRVLDVSNKGVPVFTEDDLVYATTATLPGKQIATKDVPYNGFNFLCNIRNTDVVKFVLFGFANKINIILYTRNGHCFRDRFNSLK